MIVYTVGRSYWIWSPVFVEIGKGAGFCVYRRSYLLWPPAVGVRRGLSAPMAARPFLGFNPFRAAVPLLRQISQFSRSLSPKRDCGSERALAEWFVRTKLRNVWYKVRFYYDARTSKCGELINPSRTAVPFWGQTSLISSSLSPKRDGGSEGVKRLHFYQSSGGWKINK